MARVGELLKRPLVLGITCLAVGAAVVVLVLGVPGFGSSNTAAWIAAVASVLGVGVAAGQMLRSSQSKKRDEATRTVALASALRPFLVEYGARVQRIQAMTRAMETGDDRMFYASTLVASLAAREELSTEGRKFSAPGLGPLLNSWRDAEASLVREVARLAASIQTISSEMRRPLEDAPDRERQFSDGYEFQDALHVLLDDAARQVDELLTRCETLTAN